MLIAQISDTHYLADGTLLGGHIDTATAFSRLVKTIREQTVKPDLILVSGDVGEQATEAEYAAVAAELRTLEIPVRIVPGNHDARLAMSSMLKEMVGITASGHLCLLDQQFDISIIGLDSIEEGKPYGHLCLERLDWLADALEQTKDRPAVVFMHHPPIQTGLDAMDKMGLLEGKEAFRDLLEQYSHVRAILCGHMHRAIQGTFASVPVRVCPSGSHQLAFDLRKGEPYRLSIEPPQFMMHLWGEDSELISHLVPVRD